MNYLHRIFASHLIMVKEVGSTNAELLENAEDHEHGTVLCARRQTAGRGRHQRDWRSQNGGLYFSVLLKDQKDIPDTYPFVLLSALAVVRSIQSCSTNGLAIKWPNDIYINHRKICGILAESSTRGKTTNVVVGIGINVNNKVSHLKDLRHPAVSLCECKDEELDVNELLVRIINELDVMYADLMNNRFSEYLPELNRLLYSKGQEIELSAGDTIRKITPLAFTEEAKLLCLENGKETTLFLGEM
jgi:BirA family transcriptional regulator, biotin operon repressor / biotin---[acetyl-CoA-carboxylase] ligase